MKANAVSYPNQSGTLKRFRSSASPGIAEWKASWDRADRPKKTKVDRVAIEQEIIAAGERAIEFAMDGGEPIDVLYPWMEKNGYLMRDVDKAFKKQYGKEFMPYLADLWEGRQNDAMFDARNGHGEKDTEYYYVRNDKTVHPKCNPWKSQ
jgi:hypothetical protein